MKLLGSLALIAFGFSGAVSRAEDKKSLDPLQGSWTVTKTEGLPRIDVKRLVFEDNIIVFVLTGEEKRGKFKVNAAVKPALIYLDDKGGKPGIYELKGDVLRICFALPPLDKTPTEFKGGENVILMTLKRDK